MKVTAHGIERTIPTPVQYRVERITSATYEYDFIDDTSQGRVDAWLETVRGYQLSELAHLEALLRQTWRDLRGERR